MEKINRQTVITIGELELLLNLKKSRISELERIGVFKKQSAGKYLLVESIRGYHRHLTHGSAGGDAESNEYNMHRTRKVKQEADALERKALIEKGDMLKRQEYGELIQAAMMVQKRELVGLPLTLQRMVPGMTAKTIEQVTKACARCHNAVLDLQLSHEETAQH